MFSPPAWPGILAGPGENTGKPENFNANHKYHEASEPEQASRVIAP